ncbi:unnamed protein product [Dovyalis caffra]|uniref:Uncharacterized protein n=1 Tax=Dovyalis caffra TaxID=77055 RepID=A0AAV1QP43_9ROSI|nr:unnamed protein product [Dovyalis caffra]
MAASYFPTNIQLITVSRNLSSSHLTGKIAVSLLNLTAIQSLDLSDNGLTGTVPEEFVQLPNLTVLYLNGNSLTGSVPRTLKEKSNNGLLQLRFDYLLRPFQLLSTLIEQSF